MSKPESLGPLCIVCGNDAEYFIECDEIKLTITQSSGTYCASHAGARLDTLKENIRRWERTKQDKGFTADQVKVIAAKVDQLLKKNPELREKVRHPENVVAVLKNVKTGEKKVIEMGVKKTSPT